MTSNNAWADPKVRNIYPSFPEGRNKAFTLSYDDGVTTDVKLVEMIRKYGVKGTFNLNSGRFPAASEMDKKPWGHLTKDECLGLYGDDMEIAVHGRKHPFWNQIPSAQAMMDIMLDRQALERATGKIIRGAAYPYGTYNDDVVEILRLADIQYCRITGGTGKYAMKKTPDWLRYQGTCHHDDPKLMEYAQKFVKSKTVKYLKLFYVWGHSYEFERNDNWHVMEELLKKVSGLADVWYATNIEIVEYMKALDQLVYNLDETMVYNPTAKDLWIFVEDREHLVKIPSGATVKLPE